MAELTEWCNWSPGYVAYRVYQRTDQRFSVDRQGPRGCIKTVGLYSNHEAAIAVQTAHELAAGAELLWEEI